MVALLIWATSVLRGSQRNWGPMTASYGSVINLAVHGIEQTSRMLDRGKDRNRASVSQFEHVLEVWVDRLDMETPSTADTFEDGKAAGFFQLAGLLGKPGRLDAAYFECHQARTRIGSHGCVYGVGIRSPV
jgi:hypothetical protein